MEVLVGSPAPGATKRWMTTMTGANLTYSSHKSVIEYMFSVGSWVSRLEMSERALSIITTHHQSRTESAPQPSSRFFYRFYLPCFTDESAIRKENLLDLG